MAQTKSERRLAQEREKLADADIPDADRERIQALLDREQGNKAPSTIGNHAVHLRTLSRRMHTSLSEASLDDLTGCMRDMRDGVHPEVKDDGIIIQNFEASARVFYRLHDELGVNPNEIEVDEDYNGRELSPDDLLYVDDVDDYLAAAKREDLRMSALIALLLATGQRLDVARTLRLQHVKTDGAAMEVEVNTEEADTKGAKGGKPLLWAKHYVREWYRNHPFKGDPDAPLFPTVSHGRWHDVPHGEYVNKPMSEDAFRESVQRIADAAGIDTYVSPHILRHCALTRMVAEGLSEQQIKTIAGWHGDSSQFETYVTLADEIATDSVRQTLGYPTSESGAPIVGRPSLDTCDNCGERLREGIERCPTCNTPLTHSAAEESGTADTTNADVVVDAIEDGELDDDAEEEILKALAEKKGLL